MRIEARAPGGYAHNGDRSLPTPFFCGSAKPLADSFAAQAFFHDQAADECERRRLQVCLERDFNPADHCLVEASDKGRLRGCCCGGERMDPCDYFIVRALVPKLLDQRNNFTRIPCLDATDLDPAFIGR